MSNGYRWHDRNRKKFRVVHLFPLLAFSALGGGCGISSVTNGISLGGDAGTIPSAADGGTPGSDAGVGVPDAMDAPIGSDAGVGMPDASPRK